jgi:hypothetical protein
MTAYCGDKTLRHSISISTHKNTILLEIFLKKKFVAVDSKLDLELREDSILTFLNQCNLSKEDLAKALKLAIGLNYRGHRRSKDKIYFKSI